MSGLAGWCYRATCVVALASVPWVAGGCKTVSEAVPALAPAEPAVSQFEPVAFATPIQRGEGRYADLFASTSYAVWVGPEVTALKREQEAKATGQPIEPWLERASTLVPSSYIVIECHMDSSFADSSVAYDAVSFRNMSAFFELPDGRRVNPIQVLIDPHAKEVRQGTLRSFSRVNLLVFSREDLLVGSPSVPADSPGVRLVIKGVDTRFHFDWQGVGGPRTSPWAPSVQEAAAAAQLGFKDLYGRLQTLAHIFD